MPAEIGEDVGKTPLETFHAFAAELGHFFRAVLANRRGVGKAFEQEFRQRAVAGAEVQDSDRVFSGVGNRVRYEIERFLAIGFLLILSLGPVGNVVRRRPVVRIVMMMVVIAVLFAMSR